MEKTYPGLVKPTDALVADVKEVYDKNIKVALDHTTEGIKKYGAEQVSPSLTHVSICPYELVSQGEYIVHLSRSSQLELLVVSS